MDTLLPLHVIKNILNKMEAQCFTTFTPRQEDEIKFEHVMEMYRNITNVLSKSHVILGGRYTAYLEGLTNQYAPVAYYVLVYEDTEDDEDSACVNKRFFSSMLRQRGSFKPQVVFFHNYFVGYRFCQHVRFKVQYAHHTVEYRVHFLYPKKPFPSWTAATKHVLGSFPLKTDAVALTPDGRQLVRFEQATLRLEHKTLPFQYLYGKRKKYIQHIRHFGQPSTLLQLAWMALQPANTTI